MWPVLLVSAALADDPAEAPAQTRSVAPVAGHPVLDVRVGAGAAPSPTGLDPSHPVVCVEGSPVSRLSLEACGNGAGVLHHAPVDDMAHFRARWAVVERDGGRLEPALLVGAGFAEIQRGDDAPGFQFGPGGEGAVEAAGAELSTSGKLRFWLTPQTNLSLDANVGAAWIPGAREVWGTDGPLVPFGMLTVGAGF